MRKTSEIPTGYVTINGERFKAFPKTEVGGEDSPFHQSFSVVSEFFDNAVMQEKGIKYIEIQKEDIKPFVPASFCTKCKEINKKILETTK